MIQPKRSIRSFVRRDGRITPSQKQAFERLWATYGLALPSDPFDFPALFKNTDHSFRKLIIEIGFGTGHSLIDMAEKFPENDFLGVEIYRKGVGATLNAIHRKGIKNVRVISEDALNILERVTARTVDAILIFFPDPWPKKRHHKRRLIQPDFVALICEKLKVEGYLHIATDWKNYAEHIENVLTQFPNLIDISAENALIMPRSPTKFEERGRKSGHEIYEFMLKLISPEPA